MRNFEDIAAAQGWDLTSQVTILSDFIAKIEHEGGLSEYAEDMARTENGGDEDDDEDRTDKDWWEVAYTTAEGDPGTVQVMANDAENAQYHARLSVRVNHQKDPIIGAATKII